MQASSTSAFCLFLLSIICCAEVPEWTKHYSIDELFLKFRYDPYCPGLPQLLKEQPERIGQLALNFEKAKVCFEKMGLKDPVDYSTIHCCYRFAYHYEDPLAHKYMDEIAALPKEQKYYVMDKDAEILETRRMFADLLRWKAETKYDQMGIESTLRTKLLDIIWENRYHFANFMNDHWIDCIIDDLPEKQEIPQNVKELMVVRYYQMREFLDKHEMIRLPQTERAAYELLGVMDMYSDPDCVIRYLLNYSQDTDPEVYASFFHLSHLNKINTYNLDILEGIDIYDELGLKANLPLRRCYERLLLETYATPQERVFMRGCLKLIMHTCRKDDIEPYASFVYHIKDAIANEAFDKTILAYPKLPLAVMDKPRACTKLVMLIEQVNNAKQDDPEPRERLIQFIESLV